MCDLFLGQKISWNKHARLWSPRNFHYHTYIKCTSFFPKNLTLYTEYVFFFLHKTLFCSISTMLVFFIFLTMCCSARLWCHKASPRECWLGNKGARWSFSSSPPGKICHGHCELFEEKEVLLAPATCSSPGSDLSVWGKFLRRSEPSLSRASYSPCSTTFNQS